MFSALCDFLFEHAAWYRRLCGGVWYEVEVNAQTGYWCRRWTRRVSTFELAGGQVRLLAREDYGLREVERGSLTWPTSARAREGQRRYLGADSATYFEAGASARELREGDAEEGEEPDDGGDHDHDDEYLMERWRHRDKPDD